jgi:hypothetical protein
LVGDLIARRAIHERRVREMLGVYVRGESIEIERFAARIEGPRPVLEIDWSVGEQHALRRGDSADA